MDTVIGAVEVTNCKKVKFQITGSCPSAAIDKTDSCMIYMMSEDAKKMQVSTSKHSDVQLTYMKGDEPVEKAIPEQCPYIGSGRFCEKCGLEFVLFIAFEFGPL